MPLLPLHSPLENTPHKAGNGEISITCPDRHCPKCQSFARAKCLEKRQGELLECEYFHVVFTLPAELAALALQNKRQMYDLLFRATADTLQSIAADPQHLGAQIGFFCVLHSWGQTLNFHPICIVSCPVAESPWTAAVGWPVVQASSCL
jgi:Transposase zinc-binding domain